MNISAYSNNQENRPVGSIQFRIQHPKPAKRIFGTLLSTNREQVRKRKRENSSSKVFKTSIVDLKSSEMVRFPSPKSTFLLVEDYKSPTGSQNVLLEVERLAKEVDKLNKEMEGLKQQLKPVASFHYLSSREIVISNLIFSTTPLLDLKLTENVHLRYDVREGDSRQLRAWKREKREDLQQFVRNNLYIYKLLLDKAEEKAEFQILLTETEIRFMVERYEFSLEEARSDLHLSLIRKPLKTFEQLRGNKNFVCHLFEKSTVEALKAQREVLEDLLMALYQGWLGSSCTGQVTPFVILEAAKRARDLMKDV